MSGERKVDPYDGNSIATMDSINKDLFHQFIAMVPVKEINFQDLLGGWSDMNEEMQQTVILSTVLHPHSVRYPAPIQYRRCFLKHIINCLEGCNVEVAECIYEAYTDVVSKSSSKIDATYKTYSIDEQCLIVLEESTSIVSNGTTGLCTWQAAQYMAEWILEQRDIFKDRCVLELGSGLGLTGLVLYKSCQSKHVTLSDCHSNVLSTLLSNIRRNIGDGNCGEGNVSDDVESVCNARDERRIDILDLDWESVKEEQLTALRGAFDVFIAADVVYDVSIIPALVRLLSSVLYCDPVDNPTIKFCLICSTIRNIDTYQQFLASCNAAGLEHNQLKKPLKKIFYFDRKLPIEIILLTTKSNSVNIPTQLEHLLLNNE